jgi:exopolysaccharide biosynthesis protein
MGSIIGVAIFTCFGIFLTVASIKSYDPLGSPIQQGFELVLAPISSTRQSTNLTILDSRYLPRKGYLAVTTDPWSIVVPNRSAPTLQPTSEQAKNHQCFLATNGGPYNSDGMCVGAVIVDGNIVKDHFDGVGFGVTHAPNRTWVIGQVESAEQARALRLQHYVTGFDWLVYNGEDVAMGRNNTTGAVKAPRTAVGIDSEGRLMLLVADGCEKW